MLVLSGFKEAAATANHDLTVDWFYVDAKHLAYQNSGYNPRRAAGTDPDLPIRGRKRYEWQGYDPENLSLDAFTAPREHPRFVDQAWVADWNNKQAQGYHASDDNWAYGATYRVKVRYQDIKGASREAEFEGEFAELIQHEIDHLDGVLIVDRPHGLDPFCFRKEWNKRYARAGRYSEPEQRTANYATPLGGLI